MLDRNMRMRPKSLEILKYFVDPVKLGEIQKHLVDNVSSLDSVKSEVTGEIKHNHYFDGMRNDIF